jgi:hypothetical protein
MKICPNCQNTDVPDKATKCPYCLYVFEVEEKEPKIVYDPKPIPSPPTAPNPGPKDFTGEIPETGKATPAAPKKKGGKWVVLIGITVVVVLIIKSCSGKEDTADSVQSTNNNSNGSGSTRNNTSKIDSTLLDEADEKLANAKTAYDEENYSEAALPQSREALQDYLQITEDSKAQGELADRVDDAYALYQAVIMRVSEGIMDQGPIPGGYEQISDYLKEAMDMANTLYENGYVVDNSEVSNLQDTLVNTYKEMYIQAINNITTYDHWSRDEAWNIAEQAYNVGNENGTPVLFSLDDLDDPLRLRYEYCLAMVTRKRCETGLADGSMSYADAVQTLASILEETDYNPLLLQDMVNYGQQAGMNVENYRYAYEMILDIIQREEGITIGGDVDLDHFWYFNDLDGDSSYRVGDYGTTSYVRSWIRNNISGIL